eukprot:COSAG02_NODE_8717_length_2461_cov_2.060914_3_plen_127_part_00
MGPKRSSKRSEAPPQSVARVVAMGVVERQGDVHVVRASPKKQKKGSPPQYGGARTNAAAAAVPSTSPRSPSIILANQSLIQHSPNDPRADGKNRREGACPAAGCASPPYSLLLDGPSERFPALLIA